MATGSLSNARTPDFKGLASFKGKTYHTGQWPHEGVDFTGLRVGVIGTGSSAIQSIPVIAAQAKHLTVFQRTPNYSHPGAQPRPDAGVPEGLEGQLSGAAPQGARGDAQRRRSASCRSRARSRTTPRSARRGLRRRAGQQGGLHFMATYNDLALNKDVERHRGGVSCARRSAPGGEGSRRSPKLLQPTTYPIGTKRICLDIDYFETFNRDNVTLVDIREAPIEEITPTGLKTGGKEYEFDAIVFATGFDAMTGSFAKVDIRGRGDITLKREMGGGPEDLSRPDGHRLSEPVHHHRPRQPVGAVEHDRLDRAARRLDHRVPQPPAQEAASARSRRRSRPRTTGSRTSTRSPTRRSIRRPTPGTWAPTFPASRGCSCPTSAACSVYRAGLQRRRRQRLSRLCAVAGEAGGDGRGMIEQLAEKVNANAALVRRGQYLDATFLLQVGQRGLAGHRREGPHRQRRA